MYATTDAVQASSVRTQHWSPREGTHPARLMRLCNSPVMTRSGVVQSLAYTYSDTARAAVKQCVLKIVLGSARQAGQLKLAQQMRSVIKINPESPLSDVRTVVLYNRLKLNREPLMSEKRDGIFQKTLELIASKECRVAERAGMTGAYGTDVAELAELAVMHADVRVLWSEDQLARASAAVGTGGGTIADGSASRLLRQSKDLGLEALRLYQTAERLTRGLSRVRQQASGKVYAQLASHADSLLTTSLSESATLTNTRSSDGHADNINACGSADRRSVSQTSHMVAVLTEAPHGNDVCGDAELLRSRQAELADICVDAYLKGLRLGNAYCRDHVLRMLSIIGLFPTPALKAKLHDALHGPQERQVPAWLFLRFSAQLMGSVENKEGPMVLKVLEKVAHVYPKAIYHPFNITYACLGSQGALDLLSICPLFVPY